MSRSAVLIAILAVVAVQLCAAQNNPPSPPPPTTTYVPINNIACYSGSLSGGSSSSVGAAISSVANSLGVTLATITGQTYCTAVITTYTSGLGWISTLSGVPVYTGDAYLPSGGYTNCAAYIANVNARLTTTTTTTPTTNSGISSVVSKCCDGSLCNTQSFGSSALSVLPSFVVMALLAMFAAYMSL